MKLKLDESGNVVLTNDGLPIYVHEDGKEVGADFPRAVATIKTISDERDKYRDEATKAKEALAAYDGIDPEGAKAALQTIADLDKGELLTADKVDALRREVGETYKERIAELEKSSATKLEAERKKVAELQAKLDDRTLGAAFSASRFAKSLRYPPDVARSYWGSRFRVGDDGVIYAVDDKGNKLMSNERPGELAGFEESLAMMVNGSPDKDNHFAAPNARGTETGTPSNGSANGRVKTRSELNALPPAARTKFFEEGGQLTD